MAGFNLSEYERKLEKERGLPAGLMQSLRIQETGGKQKYLDDPSAYHYGLNSEGKRIAGYTGKISTAFGPYGLLESTGAKPGYGVSPLKNKSIEEQARFAADYIKGRIKSAGSLAAGLAGYGEGAKYSNQVLSRLDKLPTGEAIVTVGDKQIPIKSPTMATQQAVAIAREAQPSVPVQTKGNVQGAQPNQVVAEAPKALQEAAKSWVEMMQAFTTQQPTPSTNYMLSGGDPWQEFLSAMGKAPEVTPTITPQQDLGNVPDFFAALNQFGPITLENFDAINI